MIFKKFFRKLKKNPFVKILKKAKLQNKKTFLLAWNRALGDVSLGLYGIVYKIKEYIPDADITFLIREDLKDAFLLLGEKFITVSFWRRYLPYSVKYTLELLKINEGDFDVIIEYPDPNYWLKDQIKKIQPKLKWKKEFDDLAQKFNLPNDKILIGVQVDIETKHSSWRQYPKKYFHELFASYEKDYLDVGFVLFGTKAEEKFEESNVIDLRGKTTLIETLSILKNKCVYFIALDSGILSLFYFLDILFSLKLIALWGSKKVGIIKLGVKSPNKELLYIPLIYEKKLNELKVDVLKKHLYPNDIKNTLLKYNQKNLFEKFKDFKIVEKINFIKDLFSLSHKDLYRQKAYFDKFIKSKDSDPNSLSCLYDEYLPFEKENRASETDYLKGKKIIKNLEAACIIMAAGQGSRLGFLGPKGLFEINNKSLFEYLFEKILKKQSDYRVKLYVSIMTSHLNNDQIIHFFEKNNFFGLEKDQVDFFEQKKAPFLDEKGNWLLNEEKNIYFGPDGNGSIFQSFCKSLIFQKYLDKKIKYLSINPIDNPLLDPFDENLFGFHVNNKNEVTIKCIKRKDPFEKKGAIAFYKNKIKILEYIFLKKHLEYKFSNSGIYTVDINFLNSVKNKNLKYEFVLKKLQNDKDHLAYKTESFIFDNFDFANKVNILVDNEENFYFPIKETLDVLKLEKTINTNKMSINLEKSSFLC